MLSNAYFLAKFRFDTAENEPAENLQNFAKILQKLQKISGRSPRDLDVEVPVHARVGRRRRAAEDGLAPAASPRQRGILHSVLQIIEEM